MHILGGLQELEAVVLFWAPVSFLLFLLMPVELCLCCPTGSPQRKSKPQCLSFCSAEDGKERRELPPDPQVQYEERSCTLESGICSLLIPPPVVGMFFIWVSLLNSPDCVCTFAV